MDWQEFSTETLARLGPERFLSARLAPTDEGLEIGGKRRQWSEFREIHILAAGKPAAAQAQALVSLLQGIQAASKRLTRALAVTREEYGDSTDSVEVFHSAHPIPDERSLEAGERVAARLEAIGSEDLAIFLVSGGSSALVERLAPPFTLADLRDLNERMLREGASIAETNAARTRLSKLKGGGWVSLCRAQTILNLVSCDVPSGDPALVGSGPGVRPPAHTQLLCDGNDVVRTASGILRERGIEARELRPLIDAPVHPAVARHVAALEAHLRASPRTSFAIVSGGEAPVRVRGNGRGGRNTEFVARMAQALWIEKRLGDFDGKVAICAVASDGTDGPTEAAGGWLWEEHVRGREAKLFNALEHSNTLGFLEQTDSVIRTGPTAVNLMDLRVILWEPS